MVVVNTAPLGLAGADLSAELAARGLLCHATGPHRLRLVTHHDVTAEQIDRSLEVIRGVLTSTSAA